MALQPLSVPTLPKRRLASKLLALGVLGAVVGAYLRCRTTELDCAHAIFEGDGIAVAVCEREYLRTGEPVTGVRLANALRRSNDLLAASAIATSLIASASRGDALETLGKIAIEQERLDEAIDLLQYARAAHVAEKNITALAEDDQALARVYFAQDRHPDALRAVDSCLLESGPAGDRVIEGYCHMMAGRELGEIGYFEAALIELAHAEPLLTEHRDLGELAAERGTLYQLQELGPLHPNYREEAVHQYELAVDHARRANLPRRVLSSELNLVYSLAESGRLNEATRHLEIARGLDLDGKEANERTALEARIAYHRGDRANRALAFELNNRAYAQIPDPDYDNQKLILSVMQARIALADGDASLAEDWAHRGIALIEDRMSRAPLEMRPWMMASRRQPYEILFTAFVREHRFEDALVVFDQWHGRTLLDALSDRAEPSASLQSAALHAETLQQLFPAWSTKPLMHPLDRAQLLARLADVDVIALVVAEDEVWRITSRARTIEITDVGSFQALADQLPKLQVAPADRALAEALGVRLLGEAAFRNTPETLHVVLDGQLAGLPVVALRAHGTPLIARRAVVQPPRLSEVGCVAALPPAPRAAVIADAKGDLPWARELATRLAHRFAVEPELGAQATREAVFATADADLLHIGVHAKITGGALFLHDRTLSSLELVDHRAPPLVVLSACSSAAAEDSELGSALSTAFLADGAHQVIATLRPVTDRGAFELLQELYFERDGVADPVRALQRVQARLAEGGNPDWANFAIFGHDICRKESL